MSIYLSKLEIPGFGSGVAVWTQRINTIELGGGGGDGAMRETYFTLNSNYPNLIEDGFTLVSSGGFIDGIIYGYSFDKYLDYGENSYHVSYNVIDLTVTSEFEGLFPDFITFSSAGQIETEGLYYDPRVNASFFDQDTWYSLYESNTSPNNYYDTGEITLPLIYNEGSQGFKGFGIAYQTVMLS